MSNVGVTFDFAAESAKLRSEIEKVRKEVGSLNATAKGIEKGFKSLGNAVVGAFSIGTITAFMLKVNSAADQLNDLSDRLNVSASWLQAMQLAAQQAGGSAEGLNNVLTKMSQTIGDAMAGGKQAVQSFDRLGLSVQELSALKADEAFKRIADALQRIPNDFERASAAQDIFGKGVKEVGALLAQGSAAIDEVNRRLEEQGARLNELDVKKIGIMNDELAFQGTVVQNLGVKFLSGLTPAIGVATSALSEMFAKLGGASEAGRGFGVVLTAAIKMVEAAAYGLASTFETVREIIAALLGVITGAVSDLLGGFATLADWVGLDWLSGKLKSGQEVMAGISESLTDIAASASRNADIAGAAAIKAATNIVRAGEIYAQVEADYKAKAAAAAAANAAAQGGAGYSPAAGRAGAYADPNRTSGRQGGGITLGDAAGSKAAAAATVDPTLDPQVLYQTQVYDVLQTAYDQYSGSMLGKVDTFNSTWLGMALTNNDLLMQSEQYKNMTLGQGVSDLVNIAIQQGGALGKFGKAFAIAQTIWSTGTAIMKAFSEVPYPANIGVAAAIAAKGAMQLATIKKTNIGSGGSAPTAGGVSAASGSAAMPTSVAATRSTESDQKKATQIIISGPIVGGRESARVLLDLLQDAIDSDMLFISGNSRQAMEIRGG